MRPLAKVGLIVAGYIVAFLVAFAVVAIRVAAGAAGGQASGGMAAFGDSLLFLAVFGVAAVPSTATALYFLRPVRTFWLVLCAAAIGLAATGVAALAAYVSTQNMDASAGLSTWSMLSPLRILVAPLFALAFLLGAVFAPQRAFRFALLAAMAIEAAAFAAGALVLFQAVRAT